MIDICYLDDSPDTLRRKAAAWDTLCELQCRGRVRMRCTDRCEMDVVLSPAPLAGRRIDASDPLTAVESAAFCLQFEPTLVERVNEDALRKVAAWEVVCELFRFGTVQMACRNGCELAYTDRCEPRAWVTITDVDPMTCVEIAARREGIVIDKPRFRYQVRTVPDSEEGGLDP